MFSEFGVLRREQTIDQSFLELSSRRQTFHRRARSLLTSIRTGSTTSFAELRKTHLSGSRSESFADCSKAATGLQDGNDSLRVKDTTTSRHHNETTLGYHRRMRWTVEKDWHQQIKEDVDVDYLGLAITSTDHQSPNRRVPPSFAGKRRTQQILRHYHRPTEFNVEIVDYGAIPRLTPTIPTQTHRLQKTSADSSSNSHRSPPFHGRPAEWSPALLPLEATTTKERVPYMYAQSIDSSSTLSIESYHGKEHQVWKVSTLHGDPLSPLSFVR